MNEPVPFNQSQLLYNAPLAATVKGAEALDRSKGYEQYADLNASVGRASGEKAYILRPPNLDKVQRTNFDQSLNDREAMLAASLSQQQAATHFGASKNLRLQQKLEEAQQQLLQEPMVNQNQTAQNALLAASAEPVKQQTMKTDIQQFR